MWSLSREQSVCVDVLENRLDVLHNELILAFFYHFTVKDLD